MAAQGSPVSSSPDDSEGDNEIETQSTTQWQQQQPPLAQSSPSASSQTPRLPAPLQKRRRVTRACDECRRKKIKCCGKQPCTHCTVYSYDCTYDQPSNRRRNPAPQYIEALETRLQRAESLLRTVLPTVDLNDPNIDVAIQQRRQAVGVQEMQQQPPPAPPQGPPPTSAPHAGLHVPATDDPDAKLRSMIETTGQLDLDERGHWDFHGGSSGAIFLKRMREQFGSLLGTEPTMPFLPRPPRPAAITPFLDSPKSISVESPMDSGLPNTIDLPSRDQARTLCTNALNCACSLLRFVHQPTFYEVFDRIYDVSPDNYGDEENRFLPLLYVVLALGCMFTTEPGEEDEPVHAIYKNSIEQGLKYFRAARQMMDITDCREITSLQAVLFMIMFLQSSANLSTCYSYIGIALRSALRMGLHRNLPGNFSPIERETRKRVFYIIRKMDTYVSALLGFPQMLDNDDIDQELPLEVDDEYITKDAVLPMPPGRISIYAAANAHTRLMVILSKVIKDIYPIKGLEQSLHGGNKASYVISHAKITDIEQELAEWLDKLPMALRPGDEGTPESFLRVQQLLRLAYAHVQMMLYRPFLHYVSHKTSVGRIPDDRSYACAAACVSVARNIVHITAEMKRRGLLIGAYWFTMYTTFFSILSLLYFVLENPDGAGSAEMLQDANAGKDALEGLAKRSMAADRCAIALRGLFEQLPDRLKNSHTTPTITKKKRSAPSSSVSLGARPKRSSPDLKTEPGFGPPMRATTFPVNPSSLRHTSVPRVSLDGTRFHPSNSSDPGLRSSFHELMSPSTDMSACGTPDSSSSNSFSQPQSQFGMPQTFSGSNNGLPDLTAMMFPSSDPFAYPNQPMMEFDSAKHDGMNVMDGAQRSNPVYVSHGPAGPVVYDDLEGQLFGPLPPYLMQGQQNYETPMDTSNTMMGGMNPNDMSGMMGAGVPPNGGDMNFGGIFSGEGDEWSMLQDPRYR
ncbi:fungal specific transcription factor [Phlyctema vagabunda]|uniref:Fungal specific transcription factor n=1 Tax=Phlyctema vagabunda TaxID=108571 RepID=A0ABR4P8Q6_9HELO